MLLFPVSPTSPLLFHIGCGGFPPPASRDSNLPQAGLSPFEALLQCLEIHTFLLGRTIAMSLLSVFFGFHPPLPVCEFREKFPLFSGHLHSFVVRVPFVCGPSLTLLTSPFCPKSCRLLVFLRPCRTSPPPGPAFPCRFFFLVFVFLFLHFIDSLYLPPPALGCFIAVFFPHLNYDRRGAFGLFSFGDALLFPSRFLQVLAGLRPFYLFRIL